MTASTQTLAELSRAVVHGKYSTYGRYGCRCFACRVAQSEYGAKLRATPKEERRPKLKAEHGTRSMYTNQGCHCDLCRAADRDYKALYRARRAWIEVGL